MEILVDANQAQSCYPWQPGIIWDFDRAKKTNEAMHELGCYWLEEPRPRFNYKELSELVSMNKTKIAGGENNTVVADFHEMVEKNAYDISDECLKSSRQLDPKESKKSITLFI